MEQLMSDGLIKAYKEEKSIKYYIITKAGYDFGRTLPLYDADNNIIYTKNK